MLTDKLRLPGCLLFCAILILTSCKGNPDSSGTFRESFEQGVKRSYEAAGASLGTGHWYLDGALIGRSREDRKEGSGSLRIKGGGSATTGFDVRAASAAVRFRHARYGNDRPSALSLWYSADRGRSWKRAGKPVIASAAGLTSATFPVPVNGDVRLSIRNEGSGRVNVDELSVLQHTGTLTTEPEDGAAEPADNSVDVPSDPVPSGRDDNMALGNPDNARTEVKSSDHYLLVHPQYALSYSNGSGTANWVSWHLSRSWRGPAPRCNCFFPDNALPDEFYRPATSAYIGSGFDRGHLCPSEDRTASPADNAATFLMSNIAPQAPLLNQQPWARLEEYARSLTDRGNELYIIAGSYGAGGSGSKGSAGTIAAGRIQVPAHFWKIMVVLPEGDKDLQRITSATRVIAVDMENSQEAPLQDWGAYRTTVSSIEQATGYRFFSNLPGPVAESLKQKADRGPVN